MKTNLVGTIHEDEEQIKPGEKRGADLEVLSDGLGFVVVAVDGVSGGEHSGSGRQRAHQPALSDTDALLLHTLQQRLQQ